MWDFLLSLGIKQNESAKHLTTTIIMILVKKRRSNGLEYGLRLIEHEEEVGVRQNGRVGYYAGGGIRRNQYINDGRFIKGHFD